MKKLVVSILMAAGLSAGLKAQQLTFQSQYMLNHYLINPGAAGALDYMPISTSFRQQWAGFTDAPRTQMLSSNLKLNDEMGVGLILSNDITGPLRNMGLQASYAYHIRINDKSKLGFGLSAVLNRHTLDGSQFVLNDAVDNTLNGSQLSSFNPDAAFGAYYYGENFFAGLSIMQLLHSKFKFGDEINKENKEVRHYFLSGGYTFDLGGDFKLEPSALIKYVYAAPVQFDINTRVFYKDNLWTGLSFRNQDAIAFNLGIKRDQFVVGYSYDFTMSNIKNYSQGTHELYIEYQIPIGKVIKSSI